MENNNSCIFNGKKYQLIDRCWMHITLTENQTFNSAVFINRPPCSLSLSLYIVFEIYRLLYFLANKLASVVTVQNVSFYIYISKSKEI